MVDMSHIRAYITQNRDNKILHFIFSCFFEQTLS